jgi:NADH-quinone oxidoreductase subunit E
MGFSLIKLFLLLAIAFVLGMSVGWWLWGRREKQVMAPLMPQRPPPPPPVAEPVAESVAEPIATRTSEVVEPTTPPVVTPLVDAGPDDLKRIRGVGPSLERTLNDLGVTRFSQIVDWSEADIARVDERLRFRGRIQRDDWQGQARELMSDR